MRQSKYIQLLSFNAVVLANQEIDLKRILPVRTALLKQTYSHNTCRKILEDFYYSNIDMCEGMNGSGRRGDSFTSTISRDAAICARETDCDAKFACVLTGDYNDCPMSFLQPYFEGEFKMRCDEQYPHVAIRPDLSAPNRFAECLNTAEVQDSYHVKATPATGTMYGRTMILQNQLRLNNVVCVSFLSPGSKS